MNFEVVSQTGASATIEYSNGATGGQGSPFQMAEIGLEDRLITDSRI